MSQSTGSGQPTGTRKKLSLRSRAGRASAKFALRHLLTLVLLILLALVALTGYQMWAEGLPKATLRLPRLLIYSGIALVVLWLKFFGKRWLRRLFDRGKSALTEQVAQEVVQKSRQKAGSALDRGAAEAKRVFSDLSRQVQSPIRHAGARGPASGQVERCPACNAVPPPGARFCETCGGALAAFCAACGKRMAPGARFCESCGARAGNRN